ncbi:MAG TPA: Gfo/Idh/MocA family oxidoreductase [Verrucomicrobiae bacterium]|jgi:predicted dehydrogenase|nr:Gfo/Idh/MocA family oxidoreductase [Verrucomicrobiae bacterium]
MRKTISIGVVGIGFGQQVLVPAFRSDPRCVVSGICANRFERAQEVANKLKIPRAYRDPGELAADSEISAIAFATPPGVQTGAGLAAARAGKHLFCEKPLALDVSQGRELLAAVQSQHVVHAMDFEFAEVDAWKQARHILRDGALGKIRQVVVAWRVETYSYRAQTQSWKTRPESGGGTLNNFASHTFFYLEWLFGPIARLAARLTPREGAGAEARADLWLEFEAGFPGNAAIAADAFLGPGHRLEVYGDAGSFVLENPTSDYMRGFTLRMASRKTGQFENVAVAQDTEAQDGRIAPVSRIVSRFLDAIENGSEMSPNLRDGLRVQVLIDAARAGDRTGSWQSVTESAAAP